MARRDGLRTLQQWAMLERLPDCPCDGARVTGPRVKTANSLVELGYAERISGVRDGGGGHYGRTAEGRQVLADAKARGTEIGRNETT